MADLHPLHHSLYAVKRAITVRPRNMERLRCTREQAEGATRIALEIFCDCINAGVPFQDALCAVYLSGLEHGASARKVTNAP